MLVVVCSLLYWQKKGSLSQSTLATDENLTSFDVESIIKSSSLRGNWCGLWMVKFRYPQIIADFRIVGRCNLVGGK
jgi:hypothetical protein